jgi:hypothetical protein
MMQLSWRMDALTERAARRYCPIRLDMPTKQYPRRPFHIENWERRVVQPSRWPKEPVYSSPQQIIDQFKNERYTQALAMVVSWGTMWRTAKSIYREHPLNSIEHTLKACAESIRSSNTIEEAWNELTGLGKGQLRWSSVMTSKTLHFLCRSLGFETNPPVAIDRLIIVDQLWPEMLKHSPELASSSWMQHDHPFGAYNRYMTAIQAWASQKGWTTTQVENTIFSQFAR